MNEHRVLARISALNARAQALVTVRQSYNVANYERSENGQANAYSEGDYTVIADELNDIHVVLNLIAETGKI